MCLLRFQCGLGIIKRKGLSRTKPFYAGSLWIEQASAEKLLKYQKALVVNKLPDLMTKYIDQKIAERHAECAGISFLDGRAPTAPTLHMFAKWFR